MAATRKEDAKAQRRAGGLFPSRDVDVATALELFEWNHYRFARSTEALPAQQIPAVLAALVRKRKGDPAVLFLEAAVDEGELRGTWRAAVNALKGFQADYGWGSKEKRRVLEAVARSPRLLAATQTAAVGAERVPDAYLAVLALDGGDASLDALMPHFERAMKDPARLDALGKLARFAARSSPGLEALLTKAGAALAERKEKTSSLRLGRRLGLATGPRFRVEVSVRALAAPIVRVDIELDSASPEDFFVTVMRAPIGPAPRTSFSARKLEGDGLGLGRCTLDELPAFLARAQKKLGVKWDLQAAQASHLKGKRLEGFLAWLFAPSRAEVGP